MAIANIANGDTVQVVSWGELFGQTILNVFYYVSDGVSGDYVDKLTSLMVFADGGTGPIGKIKDMVSDEVGFLRVRAKRVWPNAGPFVELLTGDTGAISGTCLTANQALVVTKRSTIGGQGRSGSTHVAGVPASQAADGVWDGTALSAAVSLGTAIQADIAATPSGTWHPVIAPDLTGTNPNEILQCVPQDSVRVMRRRTLRVGI